MTILKQKLHEIHERASADRRRRLPLKPGQPFDWPTVTWLDLSKGVPADAEAASPPPNLYAGDQPPTYYRGKI